MEVRQSVSAEKSAGERRNQCRTALRLIAPPRNRVAQARGTRRHRKHKTDMPGKRLQLDEETCQVLDLRARVYETFPEWVDQAFADLA